MTDPTEFDDFAAEPAPADPAGTLRIAMLVYVVVNLALGLPLALIPSGFLAFIGVDGASDGQLGGLRFFGAMVVAWGIAALLVYVRPVGRAYFITAGALQLTFGAIALAYTWVIGEPLGAIWFQAIATLVFAASAVFLWWARYRIRGLL